MGSFLDILNKGITEPVKPAQGEINHTTGQDFTADWLKSPITQEKYNANMASIGEKPIDEFPTALENIYSNIPDDGFDKRSSFDKGIDSMKSENVKYDKYYGDNERASYGADGFTYYGEPTVGTATHESVHAFSSVTGADKKLSSFIEQEYASPLMSARNLNPGKSTREAVAKQTGNPSPNSQENIGKVKFGSYMNAQKGEIYPRIMDMRQHLNLVPGQEVTPEMIDKARQDPKQKQFLDFYDNDTMVKMMNTVASNDTPTNNYDSYAAYGGYTDKLMK